jgi:hypothetical protein
MTRKPSESIDNCSHGLVEPHAVNFLPISKEMLKEYLNNDEEDYGRFNRKPPYIDHVKSADRAISHLSLNKRNYNSLLPAETLCLTEDHIYILYGETVNSITHEHTQSKYV